ncbi:MAG: hypothetical protein JO317_04905, partial [Verrucomicrobiae bacterium]|nr:hypothetical protein [Verrucomicrobiae bacterium]
MNNERQVIIALTAYAQEHNDTLPCIANLDPILPTITNPKTNSWWSTTILPYMNLATNSGKIVGYNFMRCPSAQDYDGASLGVNGCFYFNGP